MAQVHMPDQLMAELKEISDQQNISVENFLASLTREGVKNYKSLLAMKARAKKVSPGLARCLLDRIVPDVPPDPGDELPGRFKRSASQAEISGSERPRP